MSKEEVKISGEMRRAFGAIVGAFVGDASGAPLEFLSLEDMRNNLPEALKFNGGGRMNMGNGQVTDDSEMAMCILQALGGPLTGKLDEELVSFESIVKREEGKACLDLDRLQHYFGKWIKKSRPFDYGNTTYKALKVINVDCSDPVKSFVNTQLNTNTS